jgi:hypothetical protein
MPCREIIIFTTTSKETVVITDYREIENFKASLPLSKESNVQIKFGDRWFYMRHVESYESRRIDERVNIKLGRPFEY